MKQPYPKQSRGRAVAFASAITLVACWAVVSGSAASAAPVDSPPTASSTELPPAALNNPDVPLSTILALPEVIQQNSTIRIDPDLDPSLPIVDTNGTPIPGQKQQALAALASGGTITIPANPLAWSPTYSGDRSVTGFTSDATVTYYFTASTEAAAYATGWTPRTGQTWYNLGSTQWVSTTVPWGNMIATPKGQAKTVRYVGTVYIHY